VTRDVPAVLIVTPPPRTLCARQFGMGGRGLGYAVAHLELRFKPAPGLPRRRLLCTGMVSSGTAAIALRAVKTGSVCLSSARAVDRNSVVNLLQRVMVPGDVWDRFGA